MPIFNQHTKNLPPPHPTMYYPTMTCPKLPKWEPILNAFWHYLQCFGYSQQSWMSTVTGVSTVVLCVSSLIYVGLCLQVISNATHALHFADKHPNKHRQNYHFVLTSNIQFKGINLARLVVLHTRMKTEKSKDTTDVKTNTLNRQAFGNER